MIRGSDPRHLLFVVDGREGHGDDDTHDDGAAYEVISVADA